MREEVVVLLAVVFMAFFVQITLEVSKDVVLFKCSRCKLWHDKKSESSHSAFNWAYMRYVTRKQTLRSLLVSYQKMDGRVWPCPSFFWYDTDFLRI